MNKTLIIPAILHFAVDRLPCKHFLFPFHVVNLKYETLDAPSPAYMLYADIRRKNKMSKLSRQVENNSEITPDNQRIVSANHAIHQLENAITELERLNHEMEQLSDSMEQFSPENWNHPDDSGSSPEHIGQAQLHYLEGLEQTQNRITAEIQHQNDIILSAEQALSALDGIGDEPDAN